MLRRVRTSAPGVMLLVGAAAAVAEFPVHAVVLEGDNVPGVGLFTRVDELVVNNLGQYLIEGDTDFSDSDQDGVVLTGFQYGGFGLLEREGQALSSPPGATLDSWDTQNLNNLGARASNYFLDNTSGSNDDSGVYFNGNLVIQESTFSTAPGLPPNTPYIGWFETRLNDSNQILQMASIDNPDVASSVDRAIIRIDNPAGVYTETLIAQEGDELLPGRFVSDFGTGPHDLGFNNGADVLYIADLDGDTTNDNTLWLNNTLVAREGDPSPIAGRNYSDWQAIDLNDAGEWAARVDLDGDTSSDTLIMKSDGTILAREGDPVPDPAFSQFNITSLSTSGPVEIDNAGNVVWYGDWDDPDTDRDTGLFLNDALIVQEGVTMIDGLVLDTIASASDGFQVSDDGQWLLFEGTLEGGIDGAFLMQIPEPSALLLLGVTLLAVRRR